MSEWNARLEQANRNAIHQAIRQDSATEPPEWVKRVQDLSSKGPMRPSPNTTMLEAFERHLTDATNALDEVDVHELTHKYIGDVRALERQMDRLLLETQDTIRRWKEGR